jgi:hypothetical protein
MFSKTTFCIGICLLLASIFIAGCTSPSNAPAAATPIPTTIQTIPPTTVEQTTVPVTATATVITTATTDVPEGKEVLHDTGTLTTKSYKTYDFKTLMGFKFLYPKDKFKVTIKSEKPVLGYAMNTEQARQLEGSQLIPRYQTYTKGIDWGLIEPSMVLEKATDTTKEFTLENVGPLIYVVDGRWMSYDSAYDNVQSFTYEITIVKTGGPTQQNFNF